MVPICLKELLNYSYLKKEFPYRKISDYHLNIPSIKYGSPLGEVEYKGKIFYNIGLDDLSASTTYSRTEFDNLSAIWISLRNIIYN